MKFIDMQYLKFFTLTFAIALASAAPAMAQTLSLAGDSPNKVINDCDKEKNDINTVVKTAEADCLEWAESAGKKSGHGSKGDGESSTDDGSSQYNSTVNAIIKAGDNPNAWDDSLLMKCKTQYGLSSQCIKPTTDAAEDDPDAEGGEPVYNPDDKSAQNSPQCKAQYAKQFASELKSNRELMNKADEKNVTAQQDMATAMQQSQEKQNTLNKQLQEITPRIQQDLLQLRKSLTGEQQQVRTQINQLLGELNGEIANQKSLNEQMNALVQSYNKHAQTLGMQCKQGVLNSAPPGGQLMPTLNYLSKCAQMGGSQICQCLRNSDYLNKQADLWDKDEAALDDLRNRYRQSGVKIANLENALTNSQKNLSEDNKNAQEEILQKTEAAKNQAMQITKELQQAQQFDQQNMMRLQAQAKKAQADLDKYTKDYNESEKGYQATKAFAKGDTSDDSSSPADIKVTEIDKAQGQISAFNDKQKLCTSFGGPNQTNASAGTGGASGSGQQRNPSGYSPNAGSGSLNCNSGPCLQPTTRTQ